MKPVATIRPASIGDASEIGRLSKELGCEAVASDIRIRLHPPLQVDAVLVLEERGGYTLRHPGEP